MAQSKIQPEILGAGTTKQSPIRLDLCKNSAGSNMVYLDHNATTPMPLSVIEAMVEIMGETLNASSIHCYGRRAKSLLEEARHNLASLLSIGNDMEIIFTSGGTESNNLVLKGLSGHYHVMTSPTEHASILEVVGEGILLIDNNGVIRLDALEELCSTQQVPFMVSVMIANNETGVIQPIAEIANIVHRYGGIIHTDAIQALGKIPINLPELGVDLLTLSAHKVGGPLGVGALIMKKFLPLKPLLQGGGQEFRYRSGSHNIPGIYAFVVAAELAVKRLGEYALLSRLRDGLEERIARINTDTIFFGQKAHRLPNTSSFTMANVLSETQVIYFDLKGVAISAGAACSSGKSAIPHVQMSMGYTEAVARTSIRMSLGLDSAPEDIDCFVEAWEELYCNSNKMISGV